jgi:hypothetical protein
MAGFADAEVAAGPGLAFAGFAEAVSSLTGFGASAAAFAGFGVAGAVLRATSAATGGV